MESYLLTASLLAAYLLDKLLGDPHWLPHPIVLFGNTINLFERKLNSGTFRFVKGMLTVMVLVPGTFLIFRLLNTVFQNYHWVAAAIFNTIFIYYGLAGTTLIKEAKLVFQKLDIGLREGRQQVSRIVGRDTQSLSEQEVKAATLETLSENLSDGVIAPLFWFAVAGIPGIMTYKMINTLDSMIGYKNDRYLQFGRCAAYLDDIVNLIPARIAAFLMASLQGSLRAFRYIIKYGRAHSSPNSGYPEAALAGILNAQFGGAHNYFGKKLEKPFIGSNRRKFNHNDLKTAIKINLKVEITSVAIIAVLIYNQTCPIFAGMFNV